MARGNADARAWVWADAGTGLREVGRVLKPGSRIAFGFTPYSGQPSVRLTEILLGAGFTHPRVEENPYGSCAPATRP